MIHTGIIGEGKMGTNLFHYFLDKNLRLTWICSEDAEVEKIRNQVRKRLARLVEAGIIGEKQFTEIMENILISKNTEDISGCDLIIEAVTEDETVKKELFIQLDAHAKAECIFTTNSSSIVPSKLVPSKQRRERMAGLHFFYPVALKNIAELIRMPETSQQTLGILLTFLKAIGRNPILLDEPNGFILNRICLGFQNEAFLMVNNMKATIVQVDRIVQRHFFPQGIFTFFDSVGLDVMLTSIRNYTENEPERENYEPLIRQLEKFVSEGKLGNKTGSGFYDDKVPAGDNDDSHDDDLVRKLQEAYAASFRKFSRTSGISASELKLAMDEYFGTDSPCF